MSDRYEFPVKSSNQSDFFGRPVASHVPGHLIRRVDLFHSSGMETDPFIIVERLHQEPTFIYNIHDPIHGQSWMPTRAKQIRYILGEPLLFSSDHQVAFSSLVGETWRLAAVEMDGAEHAKYRKLMSPWVSPAAVSAISGKIRDRARTLISQIVEDSECDFIRDFAIPFPTSIFMDLMGMPQEQLRQFLVWEDQLLHAEDVETKTRGAAAIRDYLLDLMTDRRLAPRDDIATWATQATFNGQLLTNDEVMSIYFVLFTGGLDTVTSSLGFHFKHLAAYPEQQQYLRDHPEKIATAVEEYLRSFSPVQSQRQATQDVTVDGVEIKKGDWVNIVYALGSRDPQEFEHAELVDLSRKNIRHFAFTYGPHFCLGAHLARRELQIAIEEWLNIVPPFVLKPDTPPKTRGGIVFGVDSLEIAWDRAN